MIMPPISSRKEVHRREGKGRQVNLGLSNKIRSPRLWLATGALLIVGASVLGYHRDQAVADNLLASKMDVPDPVMIQNFDGSDDTNLLDEVHVLVEADPDQIVVLDAEQSKLGRSVAMLPVYAVGAGSRARALEYQHNIAAKADVSTPHRPVARGAADQDVAPVAMLIFDLAERPALPNWLDGYGLTYLGSGFDRKLIAVRGARFDRMIWETPILGARFDEAVTEIAGEVPVALIAPYVISRDVIYAAPDFDRQIAFLTMLGLMSIGLGGALIVWGFLPGLRSKEVSQPVSRAVDHEVGDLSGLRAGLFFQPLASQDDLLFAEKPKKRQGRVVSDRITSAVNRIRSRQ
ncbi:MAG: hypothetical protein GKR98_00835 [Boseongicola sp.]|nr:MAG: hypothetical protein GKR98_00835 [Boseongicola sp.]